MQLKRMLGTVTAVGAITAAVVLYTVHPVKSSDHQDTYNLATRSNISADITDVFVFPSPSNPNNVVFAMDVSPLIMPGTGTSHFFDPSLLYQFKIAHGATNFMEDQVIQVVPAGVDATQTLTAFIGAPNEVGTTNTILTAAPAGTAVYNTPNTGLANGVSLYGGPRRDPFFFDLFAFFTFAGDRNYGTHPNGQADPGPETASNPEGLSNGDDAANLQGLAPSYDMTAGGNPGPKAPSFNGFAAGTMSNTNSSGGAAYAPALGVYACSTNPASDTLSAGPFDVLSIVVEVPKSMIASSTYNNVADIHVWATVSSSLASDSGSAIKRAAVKVKK